MAIVTDTQQRMTEACQMLQKAFEAAGYTVENREDRVLHVNRRRVEIAEKFNDNYRRTGTGKLFFRMDDEDYHSKLLHEKKGVFDYGAIVQEFQRIQSMLQMRNEHKQVKEATQRRIDAFEKEHGIAYPISLSLQSFELSVRCNNEELMYNLALIVDAEVKRWKVEQKAKEETK